MEISNRGRKVIVVIIFKTEYKIKRGNSMQNQKRAVKALDEALDSLDGLLTGVYDAMIDEDKENANKLVNKIHRARALLTNKLPGDKVVKIFEED